MLPEGGRLSAETRPILVEALTAKGWGADLAGQDGVNLHISPQVLKSFHDLIDRFSEY